MRFRPSTIAAIAGLASLPACTPLAAAAAETTADYGPVPVNPEALFLPRWALIVAVAAIGLGLAAVLWVAFGGHRKRREGLPGRLSMYTVTGKRSESGTAVAEAGGSGRGTVATSAVDLADRMVRRRNFDEALALKLDAAGLPLRPAEWVLIHLGSAIGLGLVLMLLTNFRLLPALIGVGAGVGLPFAYLTIKAARRRTKFNEQLADTLQLMAGSLSAGYSLPQAVDTVVREGSDPIAAEFNRALVESRLGVPIEDALETVAERMDSQDFLWVVMAIRVQRQVGGNLSELLTTVSDTLRERAQVRRQVQVLSAEGRLSAWILGLLPVGFGLYLLIANPTYLSPLVTEPLGLVMLVVGAVLMVFGAFWLRKIVDVEV
jgi:tight adherence protein B